MGSVGDCYRDLNVEVLYRIPFQTRDGVPQRSFVGPSVV